MSLQEKMAAKIREEWKWQEEDDPNFHEEGERLAYIAGMYTMALFVGRGLDPNFDEKRFMKECRV